LNSQFSLRSVDLRTATVCPLVVGPAGALVCRVDGVAVVDALLTSDRVVGVGQLVTVGVGGVQDVVGRGVVDDGAALVRVVRDVLASLRVVGVGPAVVQWVLDGGQFVACVVVIGRGLVGPGPGGSDVAGDTIQTRP
jgi:hypothetical protein